jgi:hypothetical protein
LSFDGDRLTACSQAAIDPDLIRRVQSAAKDKPDAGTQEKKAASMSARELVEEDLIGFLSGADTVIGGAIDKVHGKGRADALRPRGKPQAIEDTCESQLASRKAISGCSVVAEIHRDGGPSTRVAFTVAHFDALQGDRAMRTCLAVKGKWFELPHDSLERMSQRHRQLYQQLSEQQ